MRWYDVNIITIFFVLWLSPTIVLSASLDSNSLTPKQKQEVGEALRALRKIVSITKAGINKQEYASRVLDMAATVDESLRDIPDSELKTDILHAKNAYVSAKNTWINDPGHTEAFTNLV